MKTVRFYFEKTPCQSLEVLRTTTEVLRLLGVPPKIQTVEVHPATGNAVPVWQYMYTPVLSVN